jgi:hypothetical protein
MVSNFPGRGVITVGTNASETQAQRIVADLDAAVEKFKANMHAQ